MRSVPRVYCMGCAARRWCWVKQSTYFLDVLLLIKVKSRHRHILKEVIMERVFQNECRPNCCVGSPHRPIYWVARCSVVSVQRRMNPKNSLL